MRNPPRLAHRFLEWFCPEFLLEGIEGDLFESFTRDQNEKGIRYANFRFIINVLRFFRPAILMRNQFNPDFMNTPMLKNYFKISWRHLTKNKTFAAINILGLAVGMAASLLIYEYASFEKSFDSFHKNADNIYRVTTVWNKTITPGDKRATTVAWSGPNVKSEFPEVADYAYFTSIDHFTGFNSVTYKDQKINEEKIYLADPGFLRMFSFRLLKGDPDKALNDPNSIVITQSIADKYFKDENPMGKVLVVDTRENISQNVFKVTGVVEDPPANSHMDFDFLISFNVMIQELHEGSTYWHWDYTYVYLLLHPGADVELLERKMSDLRVAQFGKDMQYYADVIDFDLQPVRDIHLYSSLRGELAINGDGRSVNFLIIIGVCILLCAYINYVNLSTIKAVERKTEIGIRKVIGSTKKQLVAQLLVESFILNAMALVIAILIYRLSIPFIEGYFNMQWPQWDFSMLSVRFIVFLVIIIFGGALLSVSYPALILSSFRPAEVLKGKGMMMPISRGLNLRKALIVLQFVFCIGFTIGTYAIYQQLQHMKNHDLGMDIEQVISVRGFGFEKFDVYEKFKAQLSQLPSVKSVGATSAVPGDEIIQLAFNVKVHVGGKSTIDKEMKIIMIDETYFETIGARISAGRNFDRSIKTDDRAIIINEAAANVLGYADVRDIVGEGISNLAEKDLQVIGVVRNFNQRSLREKYEPIIFLPIWNNDYGWHKRYYLARFHPAKDREEFQNNIASVERAWKQANPERPFQYFFLDSFFDNQYKADTAFSALFLFFSGLVIFIACLGLFGLVAYTTLQRTKEIGVRKVLGASVQNILTLLSKDFLKLILLSMLIAVPLAGWGLSEWLSQYAFRIPITVWLFVLPLVGILVMALATVILKSMKVATSNPVDSLRYE